MLSFLAIRELTIKTFVRPRVNPVRMAKLKETKSNKCWEDLGNPHVSQGVQIGPATIEINVIHYVTLLYHYIIPGNTSRNLFPTTEMHTHPC